jgi:hypothetical protein
VSESRRVGHPQGQTQQSPKVLKAVLPCAADCGRFRCSVGIGSGRDACSAAPATLADAFVAKPTPTP